MLKISGYKWYGAPWACHNPVVITSSSIHIIVGLLPLSAPFTSYMLSFCLDHPADTSSWNASIPWFGGEVLWEQSVRRKGTTQHACPGSKTLSSPEKTWSHRASHVIDNTSFWCESMLGYMSADIICSEIQTVICELRQTDNIQWQISGYV